MSAESPVRPLSAEVARKIAAGEVIDRPNAIVRELMDNAVDSGASKITVEIEGGGIEKIRVADNGCGMTKDDLAVCARPHSTSKISAESDLLRLTTLGFRGEALASVAAVCRLCVLSGGYRMRASVTEDHIIEPAAPLSGTIVTAEGLFENFPARRVFLKRPASESAMCRSIFVEKSLPCPDRAFRLTCDGAIRLDLPAGQSLSERFISALGIRDDPSLFYELGGSDGAWKFRAVIGEPAVYRSSRKDIYIFVNGRRITEYTLTQAVEYGGQGYFPNGAFPVAAVFIEIDPSLVDFNIHPAKREARFQDISALHRGISSTVRAFFGNHAKKNRTQLRASAGTDAPSLFRTADGSGGITGSPSDAHAAPRRAFSAGLGLGGSPRYSFSHEGGSVSRLADLALAACGADAPADGNGAAFSAADGTAAADAETRTAARTGKSGFRFIGSALGVFLVAEADDTLYIIDKHAAHERILYDEIIENQGRRQELLVPYVVETQDKADDDYLERIQGELDRIGFSCRNAGGGRWEFTSIEERWTGTEEDLRAALLESRAEPGELIRHIAATSACKAAVKDGSVLDDGTAARLAERALSLPDPHCPHGRPVYTAVTRRDLFALVRRT